MKVPPVGRGVAEAVQEGESQALGWGRGAGVQPGQGVCPDQPWALSDAANGALEGSREGTAESASSMPPPCLRGSTGRPPLLGLDVS